MSFSFDKKIDIFNQEFWDLKQLTINGKLYAYSRTTRLVLELHIEDEGSEYSNRAIKLFLVYFLKISIFSSVVKVSVKISS